jgi:hypothetical protein
MSLAFLLWISTAVSITDAAVRPCVVGKLQIHPYASSHVPFTVLVALPNIVLPIINAEQHGECLLNR